MASTEEIYKPSLDGVWTQVVLALEVFKAEEKAQLWAIQNSYLMALHALALKYHLLPLSDTAQ